MNDNPIFKCKNCNSIIHLSIEQKEMIDNISRSYSALCSTGIKPYFNVLEFLDKTAKCCPVPDYHYRYLMDRYEIPLKNKEK